jgi:hypothetical protein
MKRHIECLVILLLYLGVFFLGFAVSHERWHAWAVKEGHCQYNILTGESLYIPRPDPFQHGAVFNMDQHK